MFARPQNRDGLVGMDWDGGDQVYGVNVVIAEDLVQVGDAIRDFKAIPDSIQNFHIRVTDGQALNPGMMQIDRHELRAKS